MKLAALLLLRIAHLIALLYWLAALVLLLLLLPSLALADTWGVATVRSYHVEGGNHEEANYGLGLEQPINPGLRLVAGFYRNSNRNDSLYAAGVWHPFQYEGWKIGGLLGGVTGYEDDISLLGGGVVTWEGKKYGMNVLFFPSKDGRVFGIQLKSRF